MSELTEFSLKLIRDAKKINMRFDHKKISISLSDDSWQNEHIIKPSENDPLVLNVYRYANMYYDGAFLMRLYLHNIQPLAISQFKDRNGNNAYEIRYENFYLYLSNEECINNYKMQLKVRPCDIKKLLWKFEENKADNYTHVLIPLKTVDNTSIFLDMKYE